MLWRQLLLIGCAATLVVGGAYAQWDEPLAGPSKGEGALVIRDGAPGYESESSTKVKRTFKRGEAVAGFHRILMVATYEFVEENGRVRVLYPKPDSLLMDDAWMDPEDLFMFVYDCCEPECVPVKAFSDRAEWNLCFKTAMAQAKAQLEAEQARARNHPETAARAQGKPAPEEKPLTNEAILDMLQAGLGDELVIAKIQQAPREELDVSAEALIKLKKRGVSKAVLDAMLKRAGSR